MSARKIHRFRGGDLAATRIGQILDARHPEEAFRLREEENQAMELGDFISFDTRLDDELEDF